MLQVLLGDPIMLWLLFGGPQESFYFKLSTIVFPLSKNSAKILQYLFYSLIVLEDIFIFVDFCIRRYFICIDFLKSNGNKRNCISIKKIKIKIKNCSKLRNDWKYISPPKKPGYNPKITFIINRWEITLCEGWCVINPIERIQDSKLYFQIGAKCSHDSCSLVWILGQVACCHSIVNSKQLG